MTTLLTFKEVTGGLAVAWWLFLAWAIAQRRDVARFTFTAYFALCSVVMILAMAQHATADLIAGAAVWLTALVTLVLIFTRQPTPSAGREPAQRQLTQPGNQARPGQAPRVRG